MAPFTFIVWYRGPAGKQVPTSKSPALAKDGPAWNALTMQHTFLRRIYLKHLYMQQSCAKRVLAIVEASVCPSVRHTLQP